MADPEVENPFALKLEAACAKIEAQEERIAALEGQVTQSNDLVRKLARMWDVK